ncbi:MAG: CsgG/HfaB family protein [Geobacteraceae bacterium]|nr:CsgG/HfaB family protein [Geobacteraceae bacterium]
MGRCGVSRYFPFLVCLAICLALSAGAALAEKDPVVDNSRTTKKLRSLKKKGAKKVVTIYEFRSGVPEVGARAATDMFTTALIKTGYFAVAERHRLNEGVMREKQLNTSGMTTGGSGSVKLAAASYIFEGTISEYSQDDEATEGGITVGGMDVGGRGAESNIGIDIRIIDAENGLVLDSVTVRKPLEDSKKSVSGLGKLAQSIAALRGKNIPLDPDARVSHSKKESIDRALRACIETAVYEITKRCGED